MQYFSTSVAALALSPLLSSSLWAQAAPPTLSSSIVGAALVTGESDLGDDDDQISWSRSLVRTETNWSKDPSRSFGLELLLGNTHFEFDSRRMDDDTLDIREFQLSAPIRMPIGRNAGLFFAPMLTFSGEDGVDFNDGTTFGAIAGIGWRLSPTLTIGPGLGLTTLMEDSSEVEFFPFLIVDWRFAEAWSLSTGSGFAASRGPGLRLAYEPTDALELGVEARFEDYEFRLNDDHEYADGIGRNRNIPVALTARYTHNKALSVTGFAGVAFDGKIKFDDENGRHQYSDEYDTTPFAGLGVTLRF